MDTHSTEEIVELVLEMEEKNDLFRRLQVNGIPVWHYIRIRIYDMLTEILLNYYNPNETKKLLEKRVTLYDWIDENVLKNQFLVGQRDVLVFNHERRAKEGKYYKCLYTDEWLRYLKESYYVYELPYYNNFHFKPVKTKNLKYIDYGKYSRIFNKKNNNGIYQKDAVRCSSEVIQVLEHEFSMTLSARYKRNIFQIILGAVNYRESVRDYYGYLLRRIRPKVIIYVVGYSYDHMVLAELGKELGIPTIEIEHANTSRHLAYNFKGNLALKSFPDYLFVAGQYEKDSLRAPINKDQIHVVGSPELDRQTDYYKKALSNKKKTKRVITFITSGDTELAETAVELCEKLDKSKYSVYFKLHPSEYSNWRRKYRNLEQSGVRVVDDSKHNIYYYLAISDFVIGIASNALFEATRFNCHILLLKKGRYYYAKEIVEAGCGKYIGSVEDAIEQIELQKSRRSESDYFYRRNSCELTIAAIESIMKNHNKGNGNSSTLD